MKTNLSIYNEFVMVISTVAQKKNVSLEFERPDFENYWDECFFEAEGDFTDILEFIIEAYETTEEEALDFINEGLPGQFGGLKS
jgi:hypothetical protein